MSEVKVFVTGPRLKYLGGFDEYNSINTEIKSIVDNTLYDFMSSYEKGTEFKFYIGVDQGVEQWGINTLLLMRDDFNIKIELLLPYRDMGNTWPNECQVKLSELKKKVANIIVVDELDEYKTNTAREHKYSKVKMINLNRYGVSQATNIILFKIKDCFETDYCERFANENQDHILKIQRMK